MKTLAEGNDLLTTGMKTGQLERVLIGLRAAVTKEKLVVGTPRNLTQFRRQFLLQRDADRIGIEPNLVQLLGDTLYIMRMRMTDGDHSMTAIKIQVLLSLLIPYIGTLGFDDRNVVDRVNI